VEEGSEASLLHTNTSLNKRTTVIPTERRNLNKATYGNQSLEAKRENLLREG